MIIENIFRVSLQCKIEGKRRYFTWRGKSEKFGDAPSEEKLTLSWLLNSNMVKPEKLDHLHLVYHFTVPLKFIKGCMISQEDQRFLTVGLYREYICFSRPSVETYCCTS